MAIIDDAIYVDGGGTENPGSPGVQAQGWL